tara:strand:+ start:441 stop:1157 length:717 start_codon:yes stop_codon:yes gene_type:complete
MRLLITGCEYAGKKTIATEVSKWMIEAMGLRLVRWHSHFVVPQLDGHLLVHAAGDQTTIGKTGADLNTAEDEEQILSLRPSVLEQLQRHNVWRHLHPDIFRDEDTLFINHYYAEAVYAPIYYGYGEPGSFADRRARARAWDAELQELAPDMVLILVRAAARLIRERMRQAPRIRSILRAGDVELVLDRFDEEYDNSLVERKFILDTTSATTEETQEQFLQQVWPHLTKVDRLRIATRR